MKRILALLLSSLLINSCTNPKKQPNVSESLTQQNIAISEISSDTQTYILNQINKINSNKISQQLEIATGLSTPSGVIVKAINPEKTFIDSLVFIGGSCANPNKYEMKVICGLPLTYEIYASKTLPNTTPYQLHLEIQIKVDRQSKELIQRLLQQTDLIDNYNFFIHLGFVDDSKDKELSYKLDNDFLIGDKPLTINVTLFRNTPDSKWARYSFILESTYLSFFDEYYSK